MSWSDWFLLIFFGGPLITLAGDYWEATFYGLVADARDAIERFRSWREGRRRV
jgi:hypothetical protein